MGRPAYNAGTIDKGSRIESGGMDIREAGDKNVAKMHGEEEDGKRGHRAPIEKKSHTF